MMDLRDGDLLAIVLVVSCSSSKSLASVSPLGRSLHKGEIKRGSPDQPLKAEDANEASFS